jgi:hypothetical protein
MPPRLKWHRPRCYRRRSESRDRTLCQQASVRPERQGGAIGRRREASRVAGSSPAPAAMNENLPVRKTKCQTCPFRDGSKYTKLAGALTASALIDASRICHSTGSNAINHRTGIKPHLCRGSRDVQLRFFASSGFIAEATDEAWNEKRERMGMKPQEIKDPKQKGI